VKETQAFLCIRTGKENHCSAIDALGTNPLVSISQEKVVIAYNKINFRQCTKVLWLDGKKADRPSCMTSSIGSAVQARGKGAKMHGLSLAVNAAVKIYPERFVVCLFMW